MLNRFEAAGIALSIVAMAVVLWAVRMDSVNQELAQIDSVETEESGLVVIADGENQRAAVADALDAASSGGKLQKLIIDDVTLGDGAEVNTGDTVTVHYIGTLQNGQQFDNSYQKAQPFTFTVGEGRVIKGWEQGILGMRAGGQRIVVIPPELGYGRAGFGPIPGDATLVFAIELIAIEK